MLFRAGVGFVRIIDRDFIESHNLQRQVLFDETDIAANLPKAEAAARKLRGFHIWRSRRSALGSLNLELRAMKLLQCDPKDFHRQLNSILTFERQLRDKTRQSRKHLTMRWS